MGTSTVDWLWLGNQSALNSDPNTAPTDAEVQQIVGLSREGSDEIKPTKLTGTTYPSNAAQKGEWFLPQYHLQQNGLAAPDSDFDYISPTTGEPVTDVTLDFFSIVQIDVLTPDGTTSRYPAVIVQMSNGDVFLRPSAAARDALTRSNRCRKSRSFRRLNSMATFRAAILTQPCPSSRRSMTWISSVSPMAR
ncbi:hypothetical protein [uncultured Paracoccus sp.]|uniref:hypothetical protein n=1 Tax=uncultured Paracoccus sp. TaxID=189685 RepID=UPI00261AF5B7|nr:hypothetical protein [uncultured Paracoccus sp.]